MKTNKQEGCNCYQHIKKVARATWICEKCKSNVSLDVVVAYAAGIDLTDIKHSKDD